ARFTEPCCSFASPHAKTAIDCAFQSRWEIPYGGLDWAASYSARWSISRKLQIRDGHHSGRDRSPIQQHPTTANGARVMTSSIKGVAPIKQSNLSEARKLRADELQELRDDKRDAVSGKHTDRSGW